MLIALGLAIWIFLFLILTEPLNTQEFSRGEKFVFLPIYGLAGATAYLFMLPLQYYIYGKMKKRWKVLNEFVFFLCMLTTGLIFSRSIYLYIVVPNDNNPYSLWYFITSIYLPAIVTIFPIIAIGRWAFGRYYEKKIDDQKIQIDGEGTYEGLRLQLKDLIRVKADDNYVEISYLTNGILKKQLIRTKLSKVEHVIPELMRTHRSYLINPLHFQQFSMDSGKLIVLLTAELVVPVSKTYATSIKQNLLN